MHKVKTRIDLSIKIELIVYLYLIQVVSMHFLILNVIARISFFHISLI